MPIHWDKALLQAAAIILLGAQRDYGQTDKTPAKFDVASIKPSAADPGDVGCVNGRFVSTGFPVGQAIRWSYQLSSNRVFGLPDWATDWRVAYDIEAKSAAPVDSEQCMGLVRQLLADRFRMVSHSETRSMRGYALTLIDGGAKLRESTRFHPGASARMNGQPLRGPEGLSMADLAGYLGAHPTVGVPVIDQTGLDGRFVFDLTFSMRDDDDRLSFFTALNQLGLKLERASLPLKVLVVDRIEKASPN